MAKQSMQTEHYLITVIVLGITTFVVALRAISRYTRKIGIGLDDIFLYAGWVSSLSVCLMLCTQQQQQQQQLSRYTYNADNFSSFIGTFLVYISDPCRPESEISAAWKRATHRRRPPQELASAAHGVLAAPLFYHIARIDVLFSLILQLMYCLSPVVYTASITLVKFAVLFLYRRVFLSKDIRYGTLVLGVITLLLCIANEAVVIFPCRPLKSRQPKDCLPFDSILIGNAISNFVTDLFILVLPVPAIWRLKATYTKKIMIMLILLSGYITVGISIYRSTLLTDMDLYDPTCKSQFQGSGSIIVISTLTCLSFLHHRDNLSAPDMGRR